MADESSRKLHHWEEEDDTMDHTLTTYQEEVEEWIEINKKLKTHGLSTIKLLHPADVSLLSGKTISFDTPMSRVLRGNIFNLMKDSDHKQAIVQDLILTNNKMKEDLEKQTSLADRYHGRNKELQILLESSRARVKELEQEQSMRASFYENEEKLLTTKSASQAKCKHYQQRCEELEREMERLKMKMKRLQDEEEKRRARQNQVFQEFKKRTARAHNVMDDKLLDVIDSYETQLNELHRELEFIRSGGTADSFDADISSITVGTSQNFKALIKSYEKQLRETTRKLKKLEEERELDKLQMDSRPEISDYRVIQQRVKKLEKLLAIHNISVPGENKGKDPYRLKKKYSTKLEDLDYLPLDFCRQYLRDISCELEAEDLEQVVPKVQKLREGLEASEKYEQFCRDVQNLINSTEAHKDKEQRSPSVTRKRKPMLSENQLQQMTAILAKWRRDQDSLDELQLSLNKLAEKVAPWLKLRLVGDASVERMVANMDKMVFDDGVVREKGGKEKPTRALMENIVEHFQTLFDVPNVSGVFPRMNDIYTKLGEVHNVMNTLRDMLGLDADAKSGDIVDSVGRLCQSHSNTTSKQLRSLLQTEDLDGVIRRLEEHNQFFPAFKEIMSKLMEILEVERLDQIIPAVRALHLLAS